MRQPAVRRVIVVVLDGIRSDAVETFGLEHLARLARSGAATMAARTVRPSVTWAALTSLICGVPPEVHGIVADSLHLPRPRSALTPLPELLSRSGYSSAAFMGRVPLLYRGVASRIAKGLGFSEALFTGARSSQVLAAGRQRLQSQRHGLLFFHFADADRAGHAHGWMSASYGAAAREVDAALGDLADQCQLPDDPHTLLITLADHGGGGMRPREHEDDHPLNLVIPLVLAGGGVRCTGLGGATLMDVPATIAWVLGAPVPQAWTGRILAEAFTAGPEQAVA